MPLHTSNTDTMFGPGIFITLATIIAIESVDHPFKNSDFNPDLALRVTFDIGKDFTPKDIICGNFRKDEFTHETIGWGGAFVVKNFLNEVGIDKELNEDNTIPTEWFDDIIGKKLYRLTYKVSTNEEGKTKYHNWNRYLREDKDPNQLAEMFLKSAKKGYPKDYNLDETTVPEVSKINDGWT